ncbi:MAG: leucine-rich repeat protein [Muribaculaceae bacterium]|nr:leucine-rich repeat protein [Muribaculaceae bacterium]
MNIKKILCMLLVMCCYIAAQAFTVSGITYNVIDEANKLVEIAPRTGDLPYTGLTTDKLKSTVTYNGATYKVVGIGAEAFASSTWENTLQLPEGILYIDSRAFDNTEGFSLKIAASVQAIAVDAFVNNKLHGLTVITTNPTFAHLSISDNPDGSVVVLTNKDKNVLMACVGARVKNYSGTTTNYVKSLVIPQQITEIGPYAFFGNKNLTSITLHKGITKFGLAAFYKTALTSITFLNPDAVYESSLLADNKAITRATLPAGMKELPASMFYCCDNLATINLPEGMTRLGKMSLSSTSVSSITLPSTLEEIDTCALQWTLISKIDLKNVKYIRNQAFSNCENLTTITGGNSLVELGSTVFTRCNKLTSAQIPEGLKRMVGGSYFRCTGLKDATIPSTVEYIERNPFVGCTSLDRVKVATGNSNFAEMDSCLYEVKDDKAYRLISVPSARLNKVMVLQPGTEVISGQAMREVELTAFIAGKGLKSIEPSAFSSIKTLTTVKVLETVPPTGADFSDEAYAGATLYVPKQSVNAYKAADGWKQFQNIVGVDVEDEGIKGDVNGDGKVEIDDLNLLLNAVLNGDDIDLNTMDINGDGKVEVDDMNLLINIILG